MLSYSVLRMQGRCLVIRRIIVAKSFQHLPCLILEKLVRSASPTWSLIEFSPKELSDHQKNLFWRNVTGDQPGSIDAKFKDLLNNLFVLDSNQRFSVEKALAHKWMK